MFKRLLFLLAISFPVIASGAVYTDAKILKVLVGPLYGNVVLITLNKAQPNTGCFTNQSFDVAFDASTPEGKIYLSSVLAAAASGKTVKITTYGNQCSNYDSVEDLRSIIVDY